MWGVFTASAIALALVFSLAWMIVQSIARVGNEPRPHEWGDWPAVPSELTAARKARGGGAASSDSQHAYNHGSHSHDEPVDNSGERQ